MRGRQHCTDDASRLLTPSPLVGQLHFDFFVSRPKSPRLVRPGGAEETRRLGEEREASATPSPSPLVVSN